MTKTDWPILASSLKEREEEIKWIEDELEKIGLDVIKQMAQTAVKQRQRAYVPYSHYQVGAVLLAWSGKTYCGNNAERASYSETDHAEESAVTGAIVAGEVENNKRRFVRCIVVASEDGGASPCGRCRQIIIEHCDNAVIVMVNKEAEIKSVTSLRILLPFAFSPSQLGID